MSAICMISLLKQQVILCDKLWVPIMCSHYTLVLHWDPHASLVAMCWITIVTNVFCQMAFFLLVFHRGSVANLKCPIPTLSRSCQNQRQRFAGKFIDMKEHLWRVNVPDQWHFVRWRFAFPIELSACCSHTRFAYQRFSPGWGTRKLLLPIHLYSGTRRHFTFNEYKFTYLASTVFYFRFLNQ